jgi:lipopolysaccharide export LptBFGC system permease protein LptF
MSLFSTVANYGGKQPTNTQNIKQFVVGANGAVVWVYKRLPNGQTVQTPDDSKRAIYIASDLYVAGSIYNPSDKKLKENIEVINDESKNLFDLNSVKYVLKSDKKEHYGFIAQEMENIYPELVNTNSLGYKSINYIELIPLLLSKMKNMQNEIDELKTQMESIKLNTK